MTKQYPAPGFLDRLNKICQDNDITLERLAEIAEVEPAMFEAYATGELKLDELTLHRILDYSGVDWMWLEHGYEPEDLKVIGDSEKLGVEYFAAGKNAEFFASAIEDTEHLVVSTINIYEVFKRILAQRDEHSALQAVAIMEQGHVIDVSSEIALTAAQISIENKIPMADSIIYATAKSGSAILWTQDVDFNGLENVQYCQRIV